MEYEIFSTFLFAFIMVILGYAKNSGEEGFEPNKIVSTFIAAIIVAILEVGFGLDTQVSGDVLNYFFLKSGIVVAIERVLKYLWNVLIAPSIPSELKI